MAAYYCIYNIDKKERFSPLDYGQGLKMFEHCWAGNSYLYELLILLMDEWKGDRLFNVSDYEIVYYDEYSDIPEEYMDKGNYNCREKKVLTYNKEKGYSDLKEYWVEKLPEMWKELSDQYVLVNYDKALFCEIDCCRDVPLNQKYCPLLIVLLGSTKIASNKYEYMKNWRFNHIGMERKDSTMISWMENISHIFN